MRFYKGSGPILWNLGEKVKRQMDDALMSLMQQLELLQNGP